MADRKALLGPDVRKLQPRLRMVANGSTEVNAIRSEQSAALSVDPQRQADYEALPTIALAPPVARQDLPKNVVRGELDSITPDIFVNVFVETVAAGEGRVEISGETARKRELVTATMSLAELRPTAEKPEVAWIEAGESLATPRPRVESATPAAPKTARRVAGAERHHGGAGVLFGVIDVAGFDFAHPDFLDPAGTTRFVRIWDQGGTSRPNPHERDAARYDAEFDYGSEIRADEMNAAIAAAAAQHLPATELEPQSQMETGSHGTHVTSIAAGNYGVAPQARIAAVLISLPDEDLERRRSFYDSTRIAHAVDYLFALGDELGLPVSINISLGTNGHAHDGSAPVSRWIDAALSVPGRCVTVAAGNAGQERGEAPDDVGFIMGRIHTSGRIPARDLDAVVEWVVVGNGIVDVSENEFEIWYGPQDRLAVSLRPPSGTWIGPVEPGEFIENQRLRDGSMISIYNELYHPANGANYIGCYLSPFFSRAGIVGIPAGTWQVRLHAREVRNGQYHGWIERDDPRRLGRIGPREAWSFPSFFSQASNVDNTSISSLACGVGVVAVANLDEPKERINISSSQGPTRDGRSKPDVAAPGTDIVAAKGFAGPTDLWVGMTGTSMASPYCAGVAALMLATQPKLTAAQIEGIIQRTSRPLPGGDFAWVNDAGFGRIDAAACVAEAASVNNRRDRTP
ncbi:MAG TPA: S8 family serine peptidase [Candidatus Limnocylindrales bacterium]|nr:S8 family serine peptidase [Candidatus Limnocylindrales bacterium]